MATKNILVQLLQQRLASNSQGLTSDKGPTTALDPYVAFVSFMKNVHWISTHIPFYW